MKVTYVLCYTQRSGSWLLTHALTGTRVAGRPRECYQDEKFIDFARAHPEQNYLESSIRSSMTRNEVTAMRVHWNVWQNFHKRCSVSSLKDVHEYLGKPRYVLTLRRDKERQAVSLSKASQTGKWFNNPHRHHKLAIGPLYYSFDGIQKSEYSLNCQEENWMSYFHSIGVEPIVTYYEDLVNDLDGSVRSVLHQLGIDQAGVIVPDPKTQKQADAISEEWLERYRMEKDQCLKSNVRLSRLTM